MLRGILAGRLARVIPQSVAALALLACTASISHAQRGGRFGGGGHVGFAHFGGFNHSLGGGHIGVSHFGGSIGGLFGHADHGHFVHANRFHRGGTTIILGLGFGTGYYDPYWWCRNPYGYAGAYPVYVPDPYPVYVEPRANPVPTDRAGEDDYYLYRNSTALPKDPELTAAISDIEKAFRENDIALIERHVEGDESIGILSRGQSRRAFKGSEYLDKTRDAFKSLKTVKFDLDRAEPADHGDWKVSGIHGFKRDDGKEARFDVSFVLHKSHDHWLIREVTADPVS